MLSADVCAAPEDGAAGSLADSAPQTDAFQKLARPGPHWRPGGGSEFMGSRKTSRLRKREPSERDEAGSAAQPLASTGSDPELLPCLTGSARPATGQPWGQTRQ